MEFTNEAIDVHLTGVVLRLGRQVACLPWFPKLISAAKDIDIVFLDALSGGSSLSIREICRAVRSARFLPDRSGLVFYLPS